MNAAKAPSGSGCLLYHLRRHALVLIMAVLLLGFGKLASEVQEGETLGFDRAFLLMLRVPGNPAEPVGPSWLLEASRDLTALGSFPVLSLIIIAVGLSQLLMRRPGAALLIPAAVLSGTALASALKAFFDRPRPNLTGVATLLTPSFPSSHATVSTIAYLTMGACLARTTDNARLKTLYIGYAAFLAFVVGLTRVYLGVHYPTDVIAGWGVGASWALLCWVAMEYWTQGRGGAGRG